MRDLIVRGGYVYDPLNGVDGEMMEILISGGKVVEELNERDARIIDASGMVVMPGGVDIHSHIAGSKINIGRVLRPEDHRRDPVPRTGLTRAGVGFSCPSTFVTGYRYAQMGYTSVMEAAVPPLCARHAHEELNDTPIIDRAAFTLLGNNHFTLKYVRDGDTEMLRAFIAWMLRATRGYAVKVVNPGGVENWKWGRDVACLDDLVENFDVTPRQVITALARANEELGLPHTVHIHCNNLGVPGNYETTIETMEAVRGIAPREGQRAVLHICHCQFNALAGESWRDVRSGAAKIARYVNAHPHITLDIGQIIFTDTTTMTADGPWQFRLHGITGNKWVNSDVEMEAGAGVVPYTYREKSPVNAVQWAIGLELALMIHDPWRVYMTTDSPNGGPFTFYPKVIAWLMSRKARTDTMLGINRACMRRTALAGVYREYDLGEIATVTRAATARALGLEHKGHLGPGADGDVAIYDIDPTEWRPSMYGEVERAFARAAYTIKGGEVVVRDGGVVATPPGRTFWVDAKVPEEAEAELMEDLKADFKSYYTVGFNNYPVQDAYLPVQERVEINARRGW